MHYSYLCCKDCFVKNNQNSMYFPNLLVKCLAICIRAQCDYEGYLQEIYVPIAVDFQEPSSMMCHTCCLKICLYLVPEMQIKFRLEILTHDILII